MVNPMEFVTTSMATITTLVTGVITLITTVPILSLCFTAGCLVPIGIKLFHKLGGKRA